MPDSDLKIARLNERLERLLRTGVVIAIDHDARTCDVQVAELTLTGRPWLTHRAGADVTWWAPSVGEQVLVLTPSGHEGSAVVLPAFYSDTNPPPAPRGGALSATVTTVMADGATFEYASDTHKALSSLPADATWVLETPKTTIKAEDGGERITINTTKAIVQLTEGKLDITCDDTVTVKAKADVKVETEATAVIKAKGMMTLESMDAMTITSDQAIKLDGAGSTIDLNASGVTVKGPAINLN